MHDEKLKTEEKNPKHRQVGTIFGKERFHNFEPFTEDDWMTWGGAEEFSDGSQPFQAYWEDHDVKPDNRDTSDIAVVASKVGIEIHIDNDTDYQVWVYRDKENDLKGELDIIAKVYTLDDFTAGDFCRATLERLGFELN